MPARDHRLAEATSLALHAEIARHLRADRRLVERARARVADWGDTVHPFYRNAWATLLDGPLEDLCGVLVDPGQHATDLRQATPFAGALDSATRMRIWRQVRGR